MRPVDPMRGWVASFPEMLEEAWRRGIVPQGFTFSPGRFLLFGGMGGSGMAGALAATALAHRGVSAFSWREPELPAWLSPEDRLVVTSYSGETWEAISMFESARERGVPLRVVASGGRLASLCESAGVPWFRVPGEMAPRASLPWLLAGVLRASVSVSGSEIGEAIQALREERDRPPAGRDPLAIARALAGRFTCLVPFGPVMDVVAHRWRNQLLENAKTASIVSPAPEMAHNEIMGWPHLKELSIPVTVVAMPDRWPLPPAFDGLLEALRQEAGVQGFPFLTIPPPSATGLVSLLSQVYLGDRISVELAQIRRVDPTPVEPITRLRSSMRKEQGS